MEVLDSLPYIPGLVAKIVYFKENVDGQIPDTILVKNIVGFSGEIENDLSSPGGIPGKLLGM